MCPSAVPRVLPGCVGVCAPEAFPADEHAIRRRAVVLAYLILQYSALGSQHRHVGFPISGNLIGLTLGA
jgi:hypothetical protein